MRSRGEREPMTVYCWASVADAGPTLNRHWCSDSRFQGWYTTWEIVGSLRDRAVACSTSDRQGSNFESCFWRAVSSHSFHHPQEVILAQFSPYVHTGGLKTHSSHLTTWEKLKKQGTFQQTRDIHLMLFQSWATFFDAGPTSKQHGTNAPCLLGLTMFTPRFAHH